MKSVELRNKDYSLRGMYHETKTPKAIVVMLHGYTGNKNENGYMFKELAFKLEEEGFSVLRYDYYGNGDSDGRFQDMTLDTAISDAKCIVEDAFTKNLNVMVLGFSMGGLIASLLPLNLLNRLTKLILISPAFNFVNICERYAQAVRINEKYIDLGGYLLHENFIESVINKDLMKQLVDITTSTLIIQGANDQTVLKEYAIKAHQKIKGSQFNLIDGAPHCYTKMEYRIKLNNIIIDFIKE